MIATSILLPAGVIPEETLVRKPTGSAEYILRKDIKIYVNTGKEVLPNGKGNDIKDRVIKSDGVCFLVSKDSGTISAIDVNSKLAIDFDDMVSAKDFLEEIIYN